MPVKWDQVDDETWHILELLRRDKMATFPGADGWDYRWLAGKEQSSDHAEGRIETKRKQVSRRGALARQKEGTQTKALVQLHILRAHDELLLLEAPL